MMMVDHSTVTLFTVQITRRHLPASFIPKSADVMGYLAEPGAKRGLVAPTCCSGGGPTWAPPSLCCERELVGTQLPAELPWSPPPHFRNNAGSLHSTGGRHELATAQSKRMAHRIATPSQMLDL